MYAWHWTQIWENYVCLVADFSGKCKPTIEEKNTKNTTKKLNMTAKQIKYDCQTSWNFISVEMF